MEKVIIVLLAIMIAAILTEIMICGEFEKGAEEKFSKNQGIANHNFSDWRKK